MREDVRMQRERRKPPLRTSSSSILVGPPRRPPMLARYAACGAGHTRGSTVLMTSLSGGLVVSRSAGRGHATWLQ